MKSIDTNIREADLSALVSQITSTNIPIFNEFGKVRRGRFRTYNKPLVRFHRVWPWSNLRRCGENKINLQPHIRRDAISAIGDQKKLFCPTARQFW